MPCLNCRLIEMGEMACYTERCSQVRWTSWTIVGGGKVNLGPRILFAWQVLAVMSWLGDFDARFLTLEPCNAKASALNLIFIQPFVHCILAVQGHIAVFGILSCIIWWNILYTIQYYTILYFTIQYYTLWSLQSLMMNGLSIISFHEITWTYAYKRKSISKRI